MKAPKGTVVALKLSSKVQAMQQTIDTMRLLIAVMVRRYGVLDQLALTAEEITAAAEGTLQVEDNANGSIVLRVRGMRPRLVVHG